MNNMPYVLAVEKLAGIEVPDRVKVDPRDDVRVVPHLEPPGLVRHLRAGHRRAVAGVFHVQRPRAHLRHHRSGLRRPHAPELVPHRRRGARPARGLGADGARIHRLPAQAPGRVRQDGDAEPHLQGAHPGRRRLHARRSDRVGRHRRRACAPAASSGISARSGPTPATRISSSTSRPATHGDCYDRAVVRVEEIRQSLRIIEQCARQHAGGLVQGRSSADDAAAQRAHDARHRDADHAFSERELGPGDSAGRGVSWASRPPRETTAIT